VRCRRELCLREGSDARHCLRFALSSGFGSCSAPASEFQAEAQKNALLMMTTDLPD
jgi:hypothetical protein